MEQQNQFLVCVRCITFNHAPYIVDAMNGFTMQQTTFPFVCVIVDDASTDGEPEIIRKYIEEQFDLKDHISMRNEETDDYTFLFARHKKNINCFFAVYNLKYNHYSIKKPKKSYFENWYKSKYFALCEGDDYWTHPKKLQRQVDFLESHPKHSLCFHAHCSLKNDGTRKEIFRYNADKEICEIKDMILKGGGFMATASMVCVRELGDNWPDWAKKSPIGDDPLMLVLAERGYVGYINEVMSCYRIAVRGSWSVRMSQDRKMRREVFLKIIQYKKGFDEWTNYKYHKFVRKTIFDLYLSYYIKSLPFVTEIIKYIRHTR